MVCSIPVMAYRRSTLLPNAREENIAANFLFFNVMSGRDGLCQTTKSVRLCVRAYRQHRQTVEQYHPTVPRSFIRRVASTVGRVFPRAYSVQKMLADQYLMRSNKDTVRSHRRSAQSVQLSAAGRHSTLSNSVELHNKETIGTRKLAVIFVLSRGSARPQQFTHPNVADHRTAKR